MYPLVVGKSNLRISPLLPFVSPFLPAISPFLPTFERAIPLISPLKPHNSPFVPFVSPLISHPLELSFRLWYLSVRLWYLSFPPDTLYFTARTFHLTSDTLCANNPLTERYPESQSPPGPYAFVMIKSTPKTSIKRPRDFSTGGNHIEPIFSGAKRRMRFKPYERIAIWSILSRKL